MKCKKGLDLFLALHPPKHCQYTQITMIWLICALINDVAILKKFYFLLVIYFSLTYPFLPRNACFLCALCGRVSALFSFAQKYMVQNHLWKIQVCPEFVNVMIKNNLLHKSGAKSKLCNRLFSIITLMNSGHTCLFHKGFCTVYFGAKENNAVTLPHSAQRKHAFLGIIKEMSKKKKLPARTKITL